MIWSDHKDKSSFLFQLKFSTPCALWSIFMSSVVVPDFPIIDILTMLLCELKMLHTRVDVHCFYVRAHIRIQCFLCSYSINCSIHDNSTKKYSCMVVTHLFNYKAFNYKLLYHAIGVQRAIIAKERTPLVILPYTIYGYSWPVVVPTGGHHTQSSPKLLQHLSKYSNDIALYIDYCGRQMK